jgi:hypothetical protein
MEKHGRKAPNLSSEGEAYLATRKTIGNKLVEKWNRTDVGVKLDALYDKNPQKARNTAILIENEEKYLKKLNEAIISQNFQTRPENVLKIVRIGSANSNRGDIFTEFPLTTTDDAIYFIDMIYESALRGSAASDKIYENINRFYAGEMYETSTTGTTATQYSITLGTVPVVKGKIWILLDREFVGYDDGNGTIVNAPGNTKLKVVPTSTYQTVTSYTLGTLKLEFTDAVAATSTIVVLAQFDSESSTLFSSYGKVSLSVSKKRFNARPMPLGYTYSTMTELMLGTTGLGNVEDLLIGAVGDEHAKSRDYKAVGLARSLALQNTQYTFDTNFAANGEVSDKLHAQKLLPKIGVIGGAIYDDIKRGKVNKMICGSQAIEYVKKHDLWKDDTTQVRTGVYFAGKLSDIDVYVCPADASLVAVNEILVTWKNPIEGMDTCLAFGVLTELTASLSYPQFYVDGNVASIEDYLAITPKFVRLLTLSNLTF